MKKIIKVSLLVMTMFLFTACTKEKYELNNLVKFNLNKKYSVLVDSNGIAKVTEDNQEYVVTISIGYFNKGEDMIKRKSLYNTYYPIGLKKYKFANQEGIFVNLNEKELILETEIDKTQYLQVSFISPNEKDLETIFEQKEIQNIIKSIKIR